MEPFSPGTNVIVGRNGSGKSNFFAAIRFVLSDTYTSLSREERAALLHEGSGSAVNTAYVEVIFANTGERRFIGYEKDEVPIRRTIGQKKDEYSVDKKVVPRNEFIQILEAAGFSNKNPFYIVPQGRVTALTNMKEKDRLNLLKEVAGTHTYENRRAESLKIMQETNNKREKIDELLEYIKDRLSELEEEKEELRDFQDKDRERRCLEYAYYAQEQATFQESLEEIEELRQGGLENTSENQRAFIAGEKAISQMSSELSRLQQQMDLLKIDRQQLEEDRRDTAKARAKAELKLKDLADSQSTRDKAKRANDAELEAVRKEIQAKEAELSSLIPEYNKRKEREAQAKRELDAAEAGRTRLFTKQTRSSQFKSKAERDAWLRKEIKDLNESIGTQKANLVDASEEVKAVTDSISKLEKDIAEMRATQEGWVNGSADLTEKLTQAEDQREALQEELKMLRREDHKLDSIIASARQEREHAERELSHTMDGATARGLATIRRLKAARNIPGAYGTLAELMDVEEPYRVAAEQTAGASLFHYIVDNEATASMLAAELYKSQGGRITFMPLAQLRPRRVNMPHASDVVPLISRIKYNVEYDAAFQQVFGKTIVCPNLTAAGQYARSHGLDAITPDGDTTNKRGAMTGGFVDPRKSRLEAVRAVNKWRDEHEKLQAQLESIRKQIDVKGQEVTRAMGEVEKLNQVKRRDAEGREPFRNELRNKLDQLQRSRDHLEAATRRRDAVDKNINDFGESIDTYEAELMSDFKKALTNQEERQLEQFSNQVKDLQKQWNDASQARREVETRRRVLEVDLQQNLRLKEDQLSSLAFENLSSTTGTGSYSDAQKELKKIQKSAAAIVKKLELLETQMDQVGSQITQLDANKATKEQEQQEFARQIERQQKKMERSLQRKALLVGQIEECAKNIRDLGVLPEEAFRKYQKMKTKDITARLKKVNEALKKYRHVNKKAFEQYNSFTTQQEQLLQRREELDASQASIEELIAHLDETRDVAIERTFKGVSKSFAEIFERLVPAGHGRLVIQRKADRHRQEPEDSDEEAAKNSVDNYVGVGISVSFNSKVMDEQQKVQQLSGGQKSLCALCLIFAIQMEETSPMVIFDEVDANLDAQYRTAVASLMQSISTEKGTQFICTTFRPEIVMVADKCYGVTFRNKSSGIGCYSADDALEFVEGQAPR